MTSLLLLYGIIKMRVSHKLINTSDGLDKFLFFIFNIFLIAILTVKQSFCTCVLLTAYLESGSI